MKLLSYAVALTVSISSSTMAQSLNLCSNARTNTIVASKICPIGTTKVTLSALLTPTIPKGTTVYGVIGGRYYAHAQGDSFDTYSSLPAKTTPAFDQETDVQVGHTFACPDNNTCLSAEEDDVSGVCKGTAAAPSAPAGKVCIYPSMVGNAQFLVGFNVVDGQNPNTPNAATPLNFATGFGLGWEAAAAGDSYVTAVWAYKAP